MASIRQDPSYYLPQAHVNLDAIVTAAAGWPTPWKNNQLTEGMQNQLDAFAELVHERSRANEAEIERLKDEIDLRDQEIAYLTKQASSLGEQLESQANTVEERLTSLATMFDETQTQWSTTFDQWLNDRRGELKKVRDDNEAALKTYETQASAELDSIKDLHASVENVTSEVASAVLAKDYGRYALNQMILAVISFVIGVCLVIWVGIELASTVRAAGPTVHTSWQWVTLKLSLSATIIGGASVALTLGNKFLKQSNTAKRMDLDLRAIGPYLADIDDQAAQETKVGIANRAFGYAWTQEKGRANDNEEKLSVGTATQLFETVIKAAKSM
ncbi:MAG: hypothetical protein ACRCWS_06985 [Propionibacteriaceae bacterium]